MTLQLTDTWTPLSPKWRPDTIMTIRITVSANAQSRIRLNASAHRALNNALLKADVVDLRAHVEVSVSRHGIRVRPVPGNHPNARSVSIKHEVKGNDIAAVIGLKPKETIGMDLEASGEGESFSLIATWPETITRRLA